MPRAKSTKFYAVRVGRAGPKVYDTWDECQKATIHFPAATHKSFLSREEAEAWIAEGTRTAPLRFTTSTLLNILDESASTQLHPPPRAQLARQPAPHPSLGPGPSTSTIAIHDSTDPASPSPPLSSTTSLAPSPSKPPVDLASLSEEQLEVLERIKSGKSVFFTGSAGTGKSYLLGAIIAHLQEKYRHNRLAVAVTASTGIASVHIDGCTIHSWSGAGLAQETADRIVGKLKYQKKCADAKERWHRVKALVIDEISMIDGTFFDKLEEIARLMRENAKPFGGIQLVICGDFAQLPPVPDRDKETGKSIPVQFAFEAQTWDACMGRPVLLRKVFRQKDQEYVDMLNAMRMGQLDDKTIDAFQKLSRPLHFADGIETTDLYPRRDQVNNANTQRLAALNTEMKSFSACDVRGRTDDGTRVTAAAATKLLDRLVVPGHLTLKVGAQVMLIKNLRQGVLVNGTLGRVLEFCTPEQATKTGTEISDEPDGQRNGRVQKRSEKRENECVPYPLVLFENGRRMLCVSTDFDILNGQGEMEARRYQVPLILAWAMSIHKSQGQTVQRSKVDLGRIFEDGQAYVALSRATSMDGLQVLNFDPCKVKANPRVIAYYTDFGAAQDVDNQFDDDDAIFKEIHGEW